MWRRYMIVCFFTNGLASVAPSMVHRAGYDGSRGSYLVLYFSVLAGLTLAFMAVRRRKLKRRDVAVGLPMGMIWVCISAVTLVALANVKPGRFWPFYSSGHVLLTTVFAYLFWKEKPHGILGYLGIALGAAAVFLLAYSHSA